MSNLINISELRHTWPGQTTPVINIGQWQVTRGARIFLHGPSGCGKSTLLHLLSGILRVQRGSVEVLGQPLHSLSGRLRDRFRAQHIGMVFQQFNLVPYLSAGENIRLGLQFSATKHGSLPVELLLDRLRLERSLLHRKAVELSTGQQQRVAVARALIKKPALILADEPTSALDQDARDSFIKLLLDCASESGSTVIFVSHDHTLAHHFDSSESLNQINATRPESDSNAADHRLEKPA